MKLYLRLLKFVKPYIAKLVAANFCMLLNSVVFGFATTAAIFPIINPILRNAPMTVPEKLPQFLRDFINYANAVPRLDLFMYVIIGMVMAFFFRGMFNFLQGYLMTDVSTRVLTDMRRAIYDKLLQFSLDFYNKSHTGALVSRITYDTSVIQNSVTEGLTNLVYQSSQVIVYIFIVFFTRAMYDISWLLVMLSFVVLPIVMLPIVQIGKKLRKISRQTQEQMGDVTTTLVETIGGMRIVKAFSMEPSEKNKFSNQNNGLYKMFMRSAKREKILDWVTEFTAVGWVCLILWLGGRDFIAKGADPAGFIVFIFAIFMLARPLSALGKVNSINQKALGAAERIFDLLDMEMTVREKPGAAKMDDFCDTIVFEKINFSYEKEAVLKGIDLTVKRGEILAIVGPSGSGKSTLVNLIPRFYDPNNGRILIDNNDIKEVTFDSLRGQVGIVTQETILFHDTIKTNIAYGNQAASGEEIINAAKIANAHDFISKLPKGYDTIVGERGYRLSGGERQRIAIARAVLKDEPILILDEATSQLDMESEKLVQDALEKLIRGRTVFVIAHRLSTVKFATKIIVLDKGRIVETGTHEELVRKNGLYKRLYDLQFLEEKGLN
ncbi:MAG: ABC transporter ATP-binding protein [Candidatus Omnitrophica bacterium]|nr:ABC transporter ATP-binding protein [Candidatus Omnitrophota bacterium]MDD5311131.1 ABC transporter ATP-binding protein [Candidatus Omnitrophota bacterium]MDD5546455.1 ABC transporter ATP-binding protein [Candidatus Omnitrophota bacterium]